jgi:heme/copper-type cytochrome/quinol oxidase subunit 2
MKHFLAALAVLTGLLAPAAAWALDTSSPTGWMPEVANNIGHTVDHLYWIILVIVIVIFLATEGLLLYSVVRFRARPGVRAQFFHGSTAIELVLAGIPTLILLYITFASGRLWADLKLRHPSTKDALHVQVFGQQFAWNFRYAGPDAAFGTADDIYAMNDLVVPVGRVVVFHFSGKDVIHSFFLPESRLKQDSVPGLLTTAWTQWEVMPVWDLKTQSRVLLSPDDYAKAAVAVGGYKFSSKPHPGKAWMQASDSAKINYLAYQYDREPSEALVVQRAGKAVAEQPQVVRHYFEIGCAQLCGTSHFAMRGTVKVLPNDQFQAWLASQVRDDYLAGTWTGIWDKFHPEFNRAL